jgi:hypothetical protein
MQVVSAPDSIGPALVRTRSLLFRPFRLGSFLKLCAVAVFTESNFGSFNFHSSAGHHSQHLLAGSSYPGFAPILAAVLLAVLLVVLALVLVILYLVTRLRFALFECLIRQSRLLRPGWHRYREQAWRFFLLSLVVGLAFFAVVVAAALPFIVAFMHLARELHAPGPFPWEDFLAVVLPLIPVVLAVFLVAVAIDMILRDFMLPHMALENASAGQAWAAVRARIATAKGAFLAYAVLRVLLPMIAVVAIVIVLIIPFILVFGVFGVMMHEVSIALAGASASALLVRTFIEGVFYLFLFALFLLVVICFGGPLAIAVRNFALVFYGGRYQVLGDILYPPPPPAPAAAPVPV